MRRSAREPVPHRRRERRPRRADRSISCGSGGNEGSAGVGAIHIPGTPTTAKVGGSVMNSCFRASENGELTASDKTALDYLY